MAAQPPGELIACHIATLKDGGLAEVVITERTGAYAVALREAYARLHRDGGWTAWRLVTADARDVSIAADPGQEHAALISAILWVPVPAGVVAALHTPFQLQHFRLTATGVSAADL